MRLGPSIPVTTLVPLSLRLRLGNLYDEDVSAWFIFVGKLRGTLAMDS